MKQSLVVLALCATSALAMAADMSSAPAKLMGYISDSKCAASHNAAAPDADCVKKCISMGAKPVFVDGKKQVWAIDNPDSVANDYGKKVTVMATADDASKTVHITKVMDSKMAKGSSGMMDDMGK